MKREGLGRFRSGWFQGFFGRFALAVAGDGSRRPVGLVGYEAIVRHKPHRLKLREGTSEADSIQIFDQLQKDGARFVIRLNHNRRLVVADPADPAKLLEAMKGGETMLSRTVPISWRLPYPRLRKGFRRTHPPRMERLAKLRVKVGQVRGTSPARARPSPLLRSAGRRAGGS